MKFVRNKVFIFPVREGKMNAVVQRPALSSLPRGGFLHFSVRAEK